MYQRQVTFGEAVNKALGQNYCNFNGRASRSEYWWFVLFMAIVNSAIGFVLGIFNSSETGISIITSIVGLAFLLPGLGLCVRRLHDTGHSGWWVLLSVIPLANILLIVWFCQDSYHGMNQYGPEPNLVG